MHYFVCFGYEGTTTINGKEEDIIWVNIGPVTEDKLDLVIHSHRNPKLREIKIYKSDLTSTVVIHES